ncbi:tetratricopeptide repeat protein 5-like [Zingiber officinale]|uniref:tetratricopeptide repeat protein 5-like n=1 Tax=Zingiber officinale TaxID=94328 RepID=UPI001C4D76B9|nr:tetratricopeptide repeat protein 5-like [Zingiber officinale]
MSSIGGEEEREAISSVLAVVDELYRIRDTYFPRNPEEKTSRLRALVDTALSLLDSLPADQRKSSLQRANYEYLRGKILDVFPDYRKEAEDHLSKAVKLNPSLADAWLSLGNCIWKKGDLPSAKNCFSLSLSKGPNKKILCQLSMLERSMAQGTENKAASIEESITHAREAVQLDIRDGNSWYNLGNACLTSFFVTGTWDHAKLQQALKAYQNAEKDALMHSNPDLYFNCASANKYLENYERALHGFEAASLRDPGLNAESEAQKIVSLLEKIESSMKVMTRAKRLASLVSSLDEISLKSSHRKVSINTLKEGLNKAVAVIGKILLFIKHEDIAPLVEKIHSQITSHVIIRRITMEGNQMLRIKNIDNANITRQLQTIHIECGPSPCCNDNKSLDAKLNKPPRMG